MVREKDSVVNMRDNAFTALADPERRRLLLELLEHNPHSDGSSDHPETIPVDERTDEEKILVRMHHNHLPMLEQAGFIEWHREEAEIGTGPSFENIEPLLRFLDECSVHVGGRSER